ncbi:MAG: STAS domain-containing protein, partial [Chlamydiia bacterium]|nr:STAS domain-containing protein [Chlamydiia bacterium]
VLLDFTNIDYLSSSGMRVLLSVYKNLKEKKRKLGVCSVADGVSDVLRMSGFMEVIPIFSTEAKAREALTPKETAKQT